MSQYVYELSLHRIAHYKSKCLIICRHQIDSHGKFRMTEMLFYTSHKYYFNQSGTRTVHITSFRYHKVSDASVQRRSALLLLITGKYKEFWDDLQRRKEIIKCCGSRSTDPKA